MRDSQAVPGDGAYPSTPSLPNLVSGLLRDAEQFKRNLTPSVTTSTSSDGLTASDDLNLTGSMDPTITLDLTGGRWTLVGWFSATLTSATLVEGPFPILLALVGDPAEGAPGTGYMLADGSTFGQAHALIDIPRGGGTVGLSVDLSGATDGGSYTWTSGSMSIKAHRTST